MELNDSSQWMEWKIVESRSIRNENDLRDLMQMKCMAERISPSPR